MTTTNMLMNEDLSISKRKLKVCDAAVNLLEHHFCNSSSPPVFLVRNLSKKGPKKNLGAMQSAPIGAQLLRENHRFDWSRRGGRASELLNLSILLLRYMVDDLNNFNDRLGSREREFGFTWATKASSFWYRKVSVRILWIISFRWGKQMGPIYLTNNPELISRICKD